MNKTESIARKILGWKLNRWDRWFDVEKKTFIPTTDFQPEKNIGHAMLIVHVLENNGYRFSNKGGTEVCFNEIKATGQTLAEAITNAAYELIEKHSTINHSSVWQSLC